MLKELECQARQDVEPSVSTAYFAAAFAALLMKHRRDSQVMLKVVKTCMLHE